MSTVCVEYLMLSQCKPGVHRQEECAKYSGNYSRYSKHFPKEGITVTLQILFLCCPEILVRLWWSRSCCCFEVGHIHPSGKKTIENGFHPLFQTNKCKDFSLTFQTLPSLTKLHFPNSSSSVSPTHMHRVLQ